MFMGRRHGLPWYILIWYTFRNHLSCEPSKTRVRGKVIITSSRVTVARLQLQLAAVEVRQSEKYLKHFRPQDCAYPSSHDHGSGKWDISNISFLSCRVIVHFCDYGRKGRNEHLYVIICTCDHLGGRLAFSGGVG